MSLINFTIQPSLPGLWVFFRMIPTDKSVG